MGDVIVLDSCIQALFHLQILPIPTAAAVTMSLFSPLSTSMIFVMTMLWRNS